MSQARFLPGEIVSPDLDAVVFRVDVDGKIVTCRVSFDALQSVSESRSQSSEEARQIFDRMRERVYAAVMAKLSADQFEDDGSILLRAADLNV
jgi:hypothetical protein